MENNKRTYLFEKMKVSSAVFTLAIPTIISQLITLIYNWTDTFFVGQLNDTYQMASVTICHPAFMVTTAIANLFGIGGASAISRAMGKNNYDRVKKISTFCLIYTIITSIIYSILIYVFKTPLLYFLGADATTIAYCEKYLFWVVIIGTTPTVLSSTFAHLVRSTGKANQASIGIALGGIINIILDPIFIFVLDLNVVGAAIATCIANLLGAFYFILYLFITKKKTILNFNIKNIKIKEKVTSDILSTGISSALLSSMAIISNASINKLMSTYSPAAISGVSVAKKIDLCVIAFAQGMSQGILPLIGYNFASKNIKRMNNIIRFSMIVILVFATCCTITFSIFPRQLVSIFIDDVETINYGSQFLRILCLSMPLTSLIFMFNTIFQGTKETTRALITILLRKGIVDVPLMIGLNALIPLYGIVISQPLVDCIGSFIAIILYITYLKKVKKTQLILN